MLPAPGTALCYVEWENAIAVGHKDGSVTLWDLTTREMLHRFQALSSNVDSIVCCAKQRLVILGTNKQATIILTKDWSKAGGFAGVTFVQDVTPDGKWLLAQDPDTGRKWLWNVETGKREIPLDTPKARVEKLIPMSGCLFRADGGQVYCFDVSTKNNLSLILPDSAGKKTRVTVEKMEGNKAAFSIGGLQDDNAPTYRISLSPDRKLLAASRRWMRGFVDVIDLASGKRLARIIPNEEYAMLLTRNPAHFSHDGKLAAFDGSKQVTVWDTQQGKLISSLPIKSPRSASAFSPVSSELAILDEEILRFFRVDFNR